MFKYLLPIFVGCATPEPATINLEGDPEVLIHGLQETVALPPLTVLDAQGQALADAAVQWTVTPADIASITPEGQLQPLADGTAQVTATAGAATASFTLQVSLPDTLQVAGLPDEGATVAVGTELPMKVRAWADGSAVTAPEVTWASSDPAVASVENGTFKAMAPGQVTVTASGDNLTASRTLTISAEAAAPVAPEGAAVQ